MTVAMYTTIANMACCGTLTGTPLMTEATVTEKHEPLPQLQVPTSAIYPPGQSHSRIELMSYTPTFRAR